MTIDGSSDNEQSQVYELVMPKGSSVVTLYQSFREGVPEDENAGAHKAPQSSPICRDSVKGS